MEDKQYFELKKQIRINDNLNFGYHLYVEQKINILQHQINNLNSVIQILIGNNGIDTQLIKDYLEVNKQLKNQEIKIDPIWTQKE